MRASATSIEAGSLEIASATPTFRTAPSSRPATCSKVPASMEEMTATVKQNADTAQQASQLASSTRGGRVMVATVVSQVVTTMNEITTSSRKISDIISVIDGIAFQTNILALNAAVEAAARRARARLCCGGGEVRTLAQRSAQAAKEIKGTDRGQRENRGTGSSLVNTAGSAMTEIVDEVTRVADLISQISAATREQSSGISHIGSAVAQLDQSTQQNAALVEQMAAAASSLNQQAHGLVEAVAVFQMDEQHSRAMWRLAAAPASPCRQQHRHGLQSGGATGARPWPHGCGHAAHPSSARHWGAHQHIGPKATGCAPPAAGPRR